MSMLSKQCKELRAEAERIGYWSPTASRLMFDAADILWSLRNKNVALLGENESLQAENNRLRELVRDMARAWWACDNERCPHGSSCDAAVSEGKLADCEMERRMEALGVEVES